MKDLAKDKAISVITSAIAAATGSFIIIWGVMVAQAASSFYSVLNAGDYINDNIYGVNIYYGSYNGQCNIIAWYGMVSTKLDDARSKVDINHYNKQPFQKNQKHTWNGTPYDYTQPSACRLLMDKYPY